MIKFDAAQHDRNPDQKVWCAATDIVQEALDDLGLGEHDWALRVYRRQRWQTRPDYPMKVNRYEHNAVSLTIKPGVANNAGVYEYRLKGMFPGFSASGVYTQLKGYMEAKLAEAAERRANFPDSPQNEHGPVVDPKEAPLADFVRNGSRGKAPATPVPVLGENPKPVQQPGEAKSTRTTTAVLATPLPTHRETPRETGTATELKPLPQSVPGANGQQLSLGAKIAKLEEVAQRNDGRQARIAVLQEKQQNLLEQIAELQKIHDQFEMECLQLMQEMEDDEECRDAANSLHALQKLLGM